MSLRPAADEEAVRKRRGERAQQARKEAILQLGKNTANPRGPPSRRAAPSPVSAVVQRSRCAVKLREKAAPKKEKESKTPEAIVEVPTVTPCGGNGPPANAASASAADPTRDGGAKVVDKGVEILPPVAVETEDDDKKMSAATAREVVPDPGESDVESVVLIDDGDDVKHSGRPAHILTHLSQMERSYLAWQPTQLPLPPPSPPLPGSSGPAAAPAAEPCITPVTSIPDHYPHSHTVTSPPPIIATYTHPPRPHSAHSLRLEPQPLSTSASQLPSSSSPPPPPPPPARRDVSAYHRIPYLSRSAGPRPTAPTARSDPAHSDLAASRLPPQQQPQSQPHAHPQPGNHHPDDGDATARRVDRILDFLKGVEEDDVKSAKNIQARHHSGDSIAAAGSAAVTDAKSGSTVGIAVFDGVKAKIMGQQMEIDEKARTLGVLKGELRRVKESLREQALEFKKDLKSKLALQRKEYETIIKRHLTFIDKLLAEKEELTKKCEALTGEVKALEKQFREKSIVLEEQHERDLKQQKELWAQAEKIKRDKWIQEKTKAIKDQTIKGLEPEIQRMLSVKPVFILTEQHKLQNRQMEEKYREELAREKNALIEQQARQTEAMRDRVVAERQRACEEEREFARQRYQKQLERDEMEFQQQRRKLLADFDEQKHAFLESHKQERQADDFAHRKQLDSLHRQMDAERANKDAALDEARRKHGAEIALLREKLAIEKEEWAAQYMTRVEVDMRNREKAFKEKLVAERDAEIEMVVQRLESETSCNSSESTRRYRMEVERLRAETADEVKQLRDQHSLALDRLVAAQNEQRSGEEFKRDLEKRLLQVQYESAAKDHLIREQKNELSRLKVDEETLVQSIRGDYAAQLDAKESALHTSADTIARHARELEELEARHQAEIDELVKEKVKSKNEYNERTVHLIEESVRKALGSKDQLLASLKGEAEELNMRNQHLERLLEQQRQELLS
ncbi:Centrosomal protein of 131 kDa [Geranomyces variabilis]|uniref:Centrosomal protein of 131 kDa n=1 Tax=Geranomyces variabilis TaxID=109894 RepID=A0AAD5TMN6_9FUNG|nr:Centrosomal protein of 131 kDa [Geranomyces variabilis]